MHIEELQIAKPEAARNLFNSFLDALQSSSTLRKDSGNLLIDAYASSPQFLYVCPEQL